MYLDLFWPFALWQRLDMKRLLLTPMNRLESGVKAWNNIKGPLEATIAVLLGQGW